MVQIVRHIESIYLCPDNNPLIMFLSRGIVVQSLSKGAAMREVVLQIRISVEDSMVFKASASGAGLKLGTWAREILRKAVSSPLPRGEAPPATDCAVAAVRAKREPVGVDAKKDALEKVKKAVGFAPVERSTAIEKGTVGCLGSAAKAFCREADETP